METLAPAPSFIMTPGRVMPPMTIQKSGHCMSIIVGLAANLVVWTTSVLVVGARGKRCEADLKSGPKVDELV